MGKSRLYLTVVVCVCLVLFCARPSYAQGVFDTIDPSRLFKQLKKIPDIFKSERSGEIQNIRKQASPEQTAPEGAESIKLHFRELVFKGDITAYPKGDFLPFYIKKIGTQVSLKDVYEIAASITRKYHSDGYILSRAIVPEQEIDPKKGSVTIHIVEGYVRTVFLSEDEKGAKLSQNIAESIAQMRPFKMNELERQILFFNHTGVVSIQAIFKPIQEENTPEGAVDLELIIARKKFGGMASVDNYGSKYHGPNQLTVAADFSNLVVPYSKITFTGVTSVPTDELNLAAVDYKLPITPGGLTLEASAGYTNSVPGKELKDLEIKSDTYHGSLGLSYPFLMSRQEKLIGKGELGFNNIRTESLGVLLNKDKIRALRLSGNYETVDRFGGLSELGLTYAHGLDILDARKTGEADLTRQEGRSDFQKIELNASRLQSLPMGYQIASSLSGQYAFDELLSSEEFGFGGQAFGRAYDSSEIVGDHGIAVLVELRYGGMKPIIPSVRLEPYAFYDIGKVWNTDTTNTYQESAASMGAGIRMQYADRLNGEFSVAQPLTHDVESRPYGAARDPRYFFKLSTGF